jgi:endo-1,4-beta-xylanase
MLSRRQTLAGGAGFMAALATGSGKTALASRVERRVPYGACVNLAPLQDEAEYRTALQTYCQQVIPEYGLYWDYLRPTRDQFNFDYGDKVLAFAEANEMLMRGHTLVWYAAMPEWTKQISSAAEAERELAIHIERVVSRYRGKVKTWHVVNEPIEETKGKVAGLRPSIWLRYLGDRYIDTAFRLAHQADPSAELILNDYDIECVGENFAARRQALATLVRDLLERGVPLHGVGLQGHIQGKYQIDSDGVTGFVSEMKSLGLSVHVTELDVIDEDLPPLVSLRDATVAARAHDFLKAVFAAARPEVIATWGITDRYTWMPMWFKRSDGLPNRPLPLDRDYQPKPLWTVIDYFCRKE